VAEVTWLTVVLVAFGAQLAVLPGEKVQFIIAGLSTRFHPLLVVAAAGTAFAGWTALEVVFGRLLQQLLPEVVLSGLTALLFGIFAVLLYRSAPPSGEVPAATDGGALGLGDDLDIRLPGTDVRVPEVMGGFLPIFAMMAFGEFGDKTQLVTITLAGNYPHPTAIWVGEMLAIIPVSLANALFFNRFSHRFDVRKAHYVGAVLFGFFSVDTVIGIVTGPHAVFGHNNVWEAAVATFAELLGTAVVVLT
jgi:putative Ca2+/H+ antiporter (TMEM165/GDT1 family)